MWSTIGKNEPYKVAKGQLNIFTEVTVKNRYKELVRKLSIEITV
jgi:transcription initiation factor TFIIIB Brf1 subunit/transcription initiation factor TFIIB